jgi:hypothetical protein
LAIKRHNQEIRREEELKKLGHKLLEQVAGMTLLRFVNEELTKEEIMESFPPDQWETSFSDLNEEIDPDYVCFELKDSETGHCFFGRIVVTFYRDPETEFWQGTVEGTYEESPSSHFPITSLDHIEALKAHALFFSQQLKNFDEAMDEYRAFSEKLALYNPYERLHEEE